MREELRELGEIRVRICTGLYVELEDELDCPILAPVEVGPVQETWKHVTVERAVTWVLDQWPKSKCTDDQRHRRTASRMSKARHVLFQILRYIGGT